MSTWHKRAKVATKGIKFECQRCSKCCSGEVVLTYWDIERISKEHPDLKWAIIPTISPRYPDLDLLYSILHVGPTGDEPGVCCYLGGNACTIYDARPLTCRTYPFSIEWKRKIKKEQKIPKQAPVFREPLTHRVYVVVYDPECPGIGKGEKVDLQRIASLEFQNLFQLQKTYKTKLKDKISNLLVKERELKASEDYIFGMKVIIQSGKIVERKGKNVPLQIVIGYNPKDISEDAAKRILDLTYDDWSMSFPMAQGSFLLYNFSEKEEFPPKLVLVYIGCEPFEEHLTIKEFSKCFEALLISEKIREKTGTTLGMRRVTFKNGEWRRQLQ